MVVFVGIENPDGSTRVVSAWDYQESAFLTFMANDYSRINFVFQGGIIFNLQKFNSKGLDSDYSRFCILENERGEKHILSDNETLLKGFVGWKNRLVEPRRATTGGAPGGSSKRKSTRIRKKLNNRRKKVSRKRSKRSRK